MVNPRVSFSSARDGIKAGTITKIRLENFMCHTNLVIELCPWVNFITGQNGSGKSAILTALCIAFGCRAKWTQRASTLKDFIKTGCSHAIVEVELRNQGEDAFKPDVYGDTIVIERRISESGSSTVVRNSQGRKVGHRVKDLQELVEHFNIDVENPCVIMSQDKSREFLHSGNNKDKFKFFYKATLLQQVGDLLQSISEQLASAYALIDELEASIRPIEKELTELERQIKNMEHLEEISMQVQLLKKKLAWAWVYDVDKQLQKQHEMLEKLKDRIPRCQEKIDYEIAELESLKDCYTKKKALIDRMTKITQEVRRNKEELQNSISAAKKEKLELDQEHRRRTTHVQKMMVRVDQLEQQIKDVHEQHVKDTQAEETKIEAKLRELEHLVDVARSSLSSLQEQESALLEKLSKENSETRNIAEEVQYHERKQRDIRSQISDLCRHAKNKITAFGGDRVLPLLRAIERHQLRFQSAPIGPIGAHLTLTDDDSWASAVENAIGKLLNAFIVTNHKDSLMLRQCAKEANYGYLQIIIYDFARPRLRIPCEMLPQTNHRTTLSVIHSEIDTVINVLVDMASAERQVLVQDYDVGKSVAFEQRISNLKEVYTKDGYKMFSRNSVQTVLPPNKNNRRVRLCSSYDNQIRDLEQELLFAEKEVEECRQRKRSSEVQCRNLQNSLNTVKEKRERATRHLASKELELGDMKKSSSMERSELAAPTVDELHQEISNIQEKVKEEESLLQKLQDKMNEVETKANDLRQSLKDLCESAKEDINACEEAERDLIKIEDDLRSVEAEKVHYESIMANKVLPDIKTAEAQLKELEQSRQESYRKASIICPESDIQALGEWDGSTPEQLSAQLNRHMQRLRRESQSSSDSLDDLRMRYQKKQRKILRKQQTYKGFREKLEACQEALNLRKNKFERSKADLRRDLTWKFNYHLGKKGISGTIQVDYKDKMLTVEVKMPQDASSGTVRDTRGLSGGERSFSTLCFSLALHDMTEAPFRAMDEFDVFMDAVSRKISLDTLVDYALDQGSQWIFITPHDISMVKQADKIKKQQMAAPRS